MSSRHALRQPPTARRSSHVTGRVLAPAVMLFALAVALWPLYFDLDATFDDGYYYLEIARRIAAGEGSTFDGLHSTNGYHPLWLLCLVPLAWLTATPEQMLWGADLLQGLLATAAAGLVYRICRLELRPGASALAVLVWVDLTYRLWLSGLEFALHSACWLATAYFYLRHFAASPPRGVRPHLVLGLLCTATFLARLDAVLLALALAAAVGRDRPRLGAFALPLLVAGIGYAGVNWLVFGHVMPVSGAVKQEWSTYLLQVDPVFQHQGWAAAKARHLLSPWLELRIAGGERPLGCGLAAALLWCLAFLPARAPAWLQAFRKATASMKPLVAFGVLHYGFYALLLHGELTFRPWYYVAPPALAALLVAAALDGPAAPAAGRRRGARLAAAAKVALASALLLHVGRGLVVWRQVEAARGVPSLRAAASWIDEHLPPGTPVGAWNAGTLGWYSSRPVVNLDGIANSWEYFERRRHDLCRYWLETDVVYLADLYRDDQFWTVLPTLPRYRRCADRLELVAVIPGARPDTSVRIYRFDRRREPLRAPKISSTTGTSSAATRRLPALVR